jgi:hypothetical protein
MFDLQRFLPPQRRAINLEIERFLDGRARSEPLIKTVAQQQSMTERSAAFGAELARQRSGQMSPKNANDQNVN